MNRRQRPVKQSPELHWVEMEMQRIGLGNFLGKDRRKLIEILRDDQDQLNSLGLDHKDLAERLEGMTKEARQALGEPVLLEGRYEVSIAEARGKIPCPWSHPGGFFRKNHVQLKDRVTGEKLNWTDLSVHMIGAHGFYQGKGSPYRLEPSVLKRVLDL